MTKIHFLSDSLKMNSGFSTVTKNLMIELRNRGYEVSMTGLQTSFVKEWFDGIEIYPLNVSHLSESDQYLTTLMKIKPDIVFNLFGSDTGDMDLLLEAPLHFKINKRLWYVPVDGVGLGEGSKYSLKKFTINGGKVVAQCNWGYEQFKNEGIPVMDTVYHGYNEKIYRKLDNKKWDKYHWYFTDTAAVEGNPKEYKVSFEIEKVGILKYDNISNDYKYSYYPIDSIRDIVKGKYVYGFVGANFGVRKRIERLLSSYAVLVKTNKKDANETLLWLHTFPISINGLKPASNGLLDIVEKLEIQKNVIFSYGAEKANGWSEEALCRLYNIFDCNVSASSGEGFGLPILESMACGVPQIGTNICSFIELIGDKKERGILVDYDYQMIQDGCVRGLVDIVKLYKSMIEIRGSFWDKDDETLRNNCIGFAQNYTWKKVTDKWVEIFNKL